MNAPAHFAQTSKLCIGPGGNLVPDDNYTVAEAAQWLTCPLPELKVLQRLGKDCSLYCRIQKIEHTLRPTPHQRWPHEKAYPARVIIEVFKLNPDVRDYVPSFEPQ